MLFDASAIISMCMKRKFDELLDGWTIELAIYEVGNAIWKQIFLRRELNLDEGSRALKGILDLINEMRIWKIEDKISILKIAVNEGITYYDASYLVAAIEGGFALVTDDKTLSQVAKNYIQTISVDELR